MMKNKESGAKTWSTPLPFTLQRNSNPRLSLSNCCLGLELESSQSWSWSKKLPPEEIPICKRKRRQPEMNPKSYGKKCKWCHFEDDHVNLNKKFYEPNAIPEMGIYLTPTTTIDNPQTIRCRGCVCDKFSPEKKYRMFWKWQLNYKVTSVNTITSWTSFTILMSITFWFWTQTVLVGPRLHAKKQTG